MKQKSPENNDKYKGDWSNNKTDGKRNSWKQINIIDMGLGKVPIVQV